MLGVRATNKFVVIADCLQTGKPSRYITNTKVNSAFHPCLVFTFVRWQVTLCDPIWQVTLRSCVMGFQSVKSYMHLYVVWCVWRTCDSKDGCDVVDDEETVVLMRSIESSLLGVRATSDDDDDDVPESGARRTDSESSASDVGELSEFAVGPPGSAAERVGDWEHVPLSLPDIDMSLTTRTSSPSYITESQAATVTSIMSSAASAATSALSFWRGWSRDK